MRQVPRSPLSFKLQRVANVPEHPPPSTRLMSCAHIANRRLSRIIGARWVASRGFGFIVDDNGGPDVFCHLSALRHGLNGLAVGTRVSFDIVKDREGRPR